MLLTHIKSSIELWRSVVNITKRKLEKTVFKYKGLSVPLARLSAP